MEEKSFRVYKQAELVLKGQAATSGHALPRGSRPCERASTEVDEQRATVHCLGRFTTG